MAVKEFDGAILLIVTVGVFADIQKSASSRQLSTFPRIAVIFTYQKLQLSETMGRVQHFGFDPLLYCVTRIDWSNSYRTLSSLYC